MTMMRVKARWTGFSGAPGYSVFHFSAFDTTSGWLPADATAAANKVRTFFDTMKLYLPSTVNVAVQTDVEILNQANGELQDVLTAVPDASVQGTASPTAPYASPVGAVVTWRTNVVRLRRRIRGRTFLVPLSSTAFEANGTLLPAALTSIGDAATVLRNTTGKGVLGVYARPPAPNIGAGEWAPITGHSIPDMGAVMRSRRD